MITHKRRFQKLRTSVKLSDLLRKRLMKPVSEVAVYSRANWFMVIPFWWKAIQKKITTANTRQRQMMRSLV